MKIMATSNSRDFDLDVENYEAYERCGLEVELVMTLKLQDVP